MRRIVIGLLGIAVVLVAFALWERVKTGEETETSAAWAHYSDRDFGWSLTYPALFQLRPFHEQSRLTENGFLVSNVTLADPPRVRTLSLPPTAVAFRLVHMVGGPAPDPDPEPVPDTRLPLADVRFLPRGQRAHRTFLVVRNGFGLRGDVWIGPEASRADRLMLTRIVRSLRFDQAPRAVSTR